MRELASRMWIILNKLPSFSGWVGAGEIRKQKFHYHTKADQTMEYQTMEYTEQMKGVSKVMYNHFFVIVHFF
jgi:hypothetical protein